MALVETYKGLGEALAVNVELINSRSGAEGLQEAFKEGGQLDSVLKLLDQKEQQLHDYETNLMAKFDPVNPGAITSDYVNRETAKNEHERMEIQTLRNRLNELSEAAGQSTSAWVRKKATDEFIAGIQQGQKVEKGFLSTLLGVIGNAFKFGGKAELVENTQQLKKFSAELANEKVARFEIPGKAQNLEQQVEVQVEQQVKPKVEVQSNAPEVIQEAAKSKIPPPPLMPDTVVKKGPPVPPEPPKMPEVNVADKVSKKAPGIMDLADELQAAAAARSAKTTVSLDHADYQYVPTGAPKAKKEEGLMSVLKDRIDPDLSGSQPLLDGSYKEQQMSVLYSAMIDGKDELVKELLQHQSEHETGEIDADWGEPVMEIGNTFSAEDLEKIRDAVSETQARVKRGEELPSKIAEKTKQAPEVKSEQASVVPKKVEESVVTNTIPGPPKMPPSAPKLPKTAEVKKPVTAKPVVRADRGDSLSEIQKGTKLKSTKGADVDGGMNVDGFEYTKTPEKTGIAAAMAGRRGAISGYEEKIEELLEDLPAGKQLNELYSAVIEGDKQKIVAIIEVGDQTVFNNKDIERVCHAATKVTVTQAAPKKIIVERGIKELAKAANIELQTSRER